MYVRHNAWLNATPDGQKDNPQPRRTKYAEGSPYLSPPDLNSYEEYLVSLWREAGTASQKGMGIDVLEWSELIAWAERFYSETIIEWVKNPDNKRHKPVPILIKYCTLPDVDLQIIRQMSQEYCWMAHEATDPKCECPKEVRVEDDDPERNAEDMLAALRQLGFIKEDGTSI